jgi:hypothetical protein
MCPVSRSFYKTAYNFSPEALSFFKFALLATFGEMAGSRIKTGNYIPSDFGLFPKAVIWGLWGIAISVSFRIFAGGVGHFLIFQDASSFPMIFFKAFTVSFFMNIFFAPIMMLAHCISDLHITEEGGRFSFANFNTASLLKKLDWDLFWGFLMKKTIPLFWIPAHTITFLLPEEFRVLFAAILSVFLGVFLSLSSSRMKG